MIWTENKYCYLVAMLLQVHYLCIVNKSEIIYDYNPFWDLLKSSYRISCKKIALKKTKELRDGDGYSYNVPIPNGFKYEIKDTRKFAMLYDTELIGDLSLSGFKVFHAVVKSMIENFSKSDISVSTKTVDYLVFKFDDFARCSKSKSKSVYYNGIEDLINNDILANGKTKGMFFFNPCVFFIGSNSPYTEEWANKEYYTDYKAYWKADKQGDVPYGSKGILDYREKINYLERNKQNEE